MSGADGGIAPQERSQGGAFKGVPAEHPVWGLRRSPGSPTGMVKTPQGPAHQGAAPRLPGPFSRQHHPQDPAVCPQNSSAGPSTPWSEREGVLRRLRPDVPLVKSTDPGKADDAGGGGGPGLGWTARRHRFDIDLDARRKAGG